MQRLKISTSNLVDSLGGRGLGYSIVCSLQNWASSFNIFAMTQVAMDVPNKRYYIEKLQILM